METKIRKPSELKTPNTIKMLIYGQPGIGKSTLALSTPSPLLLDFDNGIHRIDPRHQTDTVQIESWQDCLDVLNENLSAYRTLVIDTAGKMLDYLSVYLITKNPKLGKSNGSLSLQGYGERKGEFIGFLKRVSMLGKHVIFVAHDREERDNDNKIIRPEIGGSSAGDLIKEIDLVGYMEAIGKKRTISFDPCEKFYGKNTCHLESLIDVPELTNGKNDFLTSIIGKYNDSIEQRKQVITAYGHLMGEINASVESVVDTVSANRFIDSVQKMDHVWDSKLQASIMLKERAKTLGLVLGKDKMYEVTAGKKAKVNEENVELVESGEINL